MIYPFVYMEQWLFFDRDNHPVIDSVFLVYRDILCVCVYIKDNLIVLWDICFCVDEIGLHICLVMPRENEREENNRMFSTILNVPDWSLSRKVLQRRRREKRKKKNREDAFYFCLRKTRGEKQSNSCNAIVNAYLLLTSYYWRASLVFFCPYRRTRAMYSYDRRC